MKISAITKKNLPVLFLMSSMLLASMALAGNSVSAAPADSSGAPLTVKSNCGDDNGAGGANNGGTGDGGTGAGTGTGTTGTGTTGTGTTGTGTGTISTNAAGCLASASTNGHNLCEGANISGMEWGGNTDANVPIVKQPSSDGATPPSISGMTLSSQTVGSLTTFFAGKGMNIIRLPFLWEYMQPWVNFGDMSLNQGNPKDSNAPNYLKIYLGYIQAANAAGLTVLVDCHNYGRYYDKDVTTDPALQAAFANLWSQMATQTKGMNVYYDLMNEPHDLSNNNTWVNTLNGAITAIRATGATNSIFVEGLVWASTGAWENSTAPYYVKIKDTGNNLVFEGHAYFDAALSGDNNDCNHVPNVAAVDAEIQPFLTFLQQQNAKGYLGEFNMANKSSNTADCNTNLTGLLTLLQQTPNIVGWSWWASGGFWTSNNTWFALDSADGDGQVTRLSPFLPAGR